MCTWYDWCLQAQTANCFHCVTNTVFGYSATPLDSQAVAHTSRVRSAEQVGASSCRFPCTFTSVDQGALNIRKSAWRLSYCQELHSCEVLPASDLAAFVSNHTDSKADVACATDVTTHETGLSVFEATTATHADAVQTELLDVSVIRETANEVICDSHGADTVPDDDTTQSAREPVRTLLCGR